MKKRQRKKNLKRMNPITTCAGTGIPAIDLTGFDATSVTLRRYSGSLLINDQAISGDVLGKGGIG